MNRSDFLALIPARYASTRFPGKPLAKILGKPMIQWVFERVSEVFRHVYVATDDERIVGAVQRFGGRYVLTSENHRSGTDRCAEALEIIQNQSGRNYKVVVNVQGDEPFVRPDQLELLVQPFGSPKTQIATLVKPFAEGDNIFNPNTPKVVVGVNGNALYFSRSAIPFVRGISESEWTGRHNFFKHIGLYAYRASVLNQIAHIPQTPLEQVESLEQLRWLENGFTIAVSITDTESLAVDTPEDLERAEQWASNQAAQ